MYDKSGKWSPLQSLDDFDNGLSDLIDLWSSTAQTATQALKERALTQLKEDLGAAALLWVSNNAKSKKYAAIAAELTEFEEALQQV